MNNKQNNLLEKNKIIIKRWKKVEEKHKNHINKILISKKYKLFKSRLLGFLSGDGSVYITNKKNNKHVNNNISFYPDHKSMINPFIEAFEYLYIKKPTIKKLHNYYSVRISSKFASLDLTELSNLKTHTWEVPFSFLDSEETKVEWLRAFFDCEASILQRKIQLQSVNIKGLSQIKTLLENFGIESRIYKYERENKNWNTNYILCIMKKESRKNFLDKIGFNHTLKLNKLKKQIYAGVP